VQVDNLKGGIFLPWRRGIVVIASASRTVDPGFDCHQGVRFLDLFTLQSCCQNLICHCAYLRKINDLKIFFKGVAFWKSAIIRSTRIWLLLTG
jgi:hypothetical protein